MMKTIYSGSYRTGHCQGITLDLKKGVVYYSFTTALIKTDLEGNLIGSAYGLLGHLGCIAFNPQDGKVYGSLEYKNDQIGRGILRNIGSDAALEDAFYLAVFDVDRLTLPDMNATDDGIMKTVYLREVVNDYKGEGLAIRRPVPHKYGCSGIDGTAIGPAFGSPDKEALCLYVAYGIYGDTSRFDNNYQVLLRYNLDTLERYAAPLSQEAMHKSGPDSPDGKYFLFTGNTVFGVQNLEYDPKSDKYFLSVYPGQKPAYPNPPLFAVNRMQTPRLLPLEGLNEKGEVLQLDEKGLAGYPFNIGQTGMFAVGDGHFYLSHHGKEDGKDFTNVKLYRFEDGVFSPEE